MMWFFKLETLLLIVSLPISALRQSFYLQTSIAKIFPLLNLRQQSARRARHALDKVQTRWISHQRDGSLILFLLHTGLRISEALSLKLSDIELSERKGLVRVRQTKGITSRVVPLNATARKALQDWLAVRPETGIFLWTQVEKEPGSPLTSRTVQRILKRIGTAANLPHLTPHVLRHTFAKNLVDQGVGLEKVATLMGHANLNTTRIYTTPSQKGLENAVEKMAEG